MGFGAPMTQWLRATRQAVEASCSPRRSSWLAHRGYISHLCAEHRPAGATNSQ